MTFSNKKPRHKQRGQAEEKKSDENGKIASIFRHPFDALGCQNIATGHIVLALNIITLILCFIR